MLTSRSLVARVALGATMAVGLVAVTAAAKDTPRRTAMFGGPWISVETPVNPYDASTRGALFLVHTWVHGTPSDMPLVGRAEGLVDGKRRSVPFTLTRSAHTGTFGVQRQWGETGIWTLLVTAMPKAENGWRIQAVVDIGADGAVEHVTVPGADAGQAARVLSDAEVDRGLRDRARAMVAVGTR